MQYIHSDTQRKVKRNKKNHIWLANRQIAKKFLLNKNSALTLVPYSFSLFHGKVKELGEDNNSIKTCHTYLKSTQNAKINGNSNSKRQPMKKKKVKNI